MRRSAQNSSVIETIHEASAVLYGVGACLFIVTLMLPELCEIVLVGFKEVICPLCVAFEWENIPETPKCCTISAHNINFGK